MIIAEQQPQRHVWPSFLPELPKRFPVAKLPSVHSRLVPFRVVVTRNALEAAIASQVGLLGLTGRQKNFVTSGWDNELAITTEEWVPIDASGKRSIVLTENFEFAVFDERSPPDRHYHPETIETYVFVAGAMGIVVAGKRNDLAAGDTIVIPPPLSHEVLRDKAFVALFIVANCRGPADRFFGDPKSRSDPRLPRQEHL